jgi:hypothetical protein
MRLDGRRGNPFRVGSSKRFGCVFPKVAKAQSWAEISERFQRYYCAPRVEHLAESLPLAVLIRTDWKVCPTLAIHQLIRDGVGFEDLAENLQHCADVDGDRAIY